MTWIAAAAIVGSAVVGGIAANKAAGTQASAANNATDLQREQWLQNQANQKPWLEAGQQGLNQLTSLLMPGGKYATPFSETNWQTDPGYAFRMKEGLKALDQQAAARGGLISGAALKGATRYGQDYGSNEYQRAFDRYYTERNNMLAPLQSLAGVGQSTAQTLGTQGMQYAGNVGELGMQAANARASAYMGGANALSGGINQYLNYSNQQNLLNRLFGANSGSGSGAGSYLDAGSAGSMIG